MLNRLSEKLLTLSIIIGIIVGITYSCGPFLPNRILEEGDDYVLESPEGYFYNEVDNISETLVSYFQETNPDDIKLMSYKADVSLNTEDVDVLDLQKALGNTNYEIIEQYNEIRQQLTEYKTKMYEWRLKKLFAYYNIDEIIHPEFIAPIIPNGLPVEFEKYLDGAIFYHQEQFTKAIKTWEELLNLPANQRQYRSTWAAYMIGRALQQQNSDQEAIDWFKRTRELVDDGFADSLGLAAASIGWEAKAELDQQNYIRAVELYLSQRFIGDKSANLSLQIVCRKILNADEDIQKKAALNQLARKVITAFIVSRGGVCFDAPSSDLTEKWLKAIEAANINIVEEAGHFAWAAYYLGDTDLASQWLSKASDDDIMAKWITAKLMLQKGKVTEATQQLVRVARLFSPTDELNENDRMYNYRIRFNPLDQEIKVIRGELGTLYVSQQQYIEALDALLRGGYWEDAAYVAERVLTIEELKDYIDKTWHQVEEQESSWEMSLPQRLRYLLARRFTRLALYEKARPYYPTKWQEWFDTFIQARKEAYNQDLSKEDRAKALWKVAVITRYWGMELMGTELEPDWTVFNGSYTRIPIIKTREDKLSDQLTHSGEDELYRTTQNDTPEKRFHYRYIAADYAWQAAELMPDNSSQTARVLCIGGSWIKKDDPQAADKFYKTLVIRCRKTDMGQKADELRWFPNIEIDREALLSEIE